MRPIAPDLRRHLRSLGVSKEAIDAVWPEWWTDDAEGSLSAKTELRFTVARRLGLSPTSIFEDAPRFVWRDDARFKNLGSVTETEQSILSSFGMALGRVLISGTEAPALVDPYSASALRQALLTDNAYVGLPELLVLSWGIGMPVVKIAVYPLKAKRMHAMSVASGGRFAVILGQETEYPARVAFTLAHELGHIMLGHLSGKGALLDVEDPLLNESDDDEEAADRFALELLTGTPSPELQIGSEEFSASQLAEAARTSSKHYAIDPGVLALCVGHETGKWEAATGALKVLGREPGLSRRINEVAVSQIHWDQLQQGSVGYLRRMLGVS